jgi:hypothetical protein
MLFGVADQTSHDLFPKLIRLHFSQLEQCDILIAGDTGLFERIIYHEPFLSRVPLFEESDPEDAVMPCNFPHERVSSAEQQFSRQLTPK